MLMRLLLVVLAVPITMGFAQEHKFLVSIPPQKYLLERIVGDGFSIQVLMPPGKDIEDFEPSPQQVLQAVNSRMFITTGLQGEERWVTKLKRLNPKLEIVNNSSGISFESNYKSGAGQRGGDGMDPHYWTSPSNGIIMAGHILRAVSRMFPERHDQFEKAYNFLIRDLENLDHEISDRLSNYKGRKFFVFHPSWGYFASRYKLFQIAVEQHGSDPGTKSFIKLIDMAKNEHIKSLFVQSGHFPRSARVMAGEIGAQVVETSPLAENYIESLRSFAMKLEESFK